MEPLSSGDQVLWETGRRRSGIDFDDVFGGPPRRSSLSSRRSAEDNPPPVGRDPWGRPCTSASFREKPVFGELRSSSSFRRTELEDDFFSDIFRGGGGSECSTPKRFHRDAHTSAPASRPLSPSHRHPRPDPSAGASFVLSPRSVTQKVEETRVGSFRDHTQSRGEDGASHVGIHTASIVNGVSVSQADAQTAPHPSLSLGELLFQKFDSEDQSSPQVDDSVSISLETGVDENQTNVKDTGGIDHFHFSMHKWASKGVMLAVPPNPNQRIKNGGRLNGVPVPFLHGVDRPLNKKGLPSGDRVFTSEFGRVDNAVPGKRKSTVKFSEARTKVQDADAIHFPSDQMLEEGMAIESQFLVSDFKEEKDTRSDGASNAPHTSEKEEVSASHENHIGGKGHKLENEVEDSLQQTALVRSAEDPVERNQAVKMTIIGPSGAAERHLGYNMPSDIICGKVKDFIKIFDQDVSSKPMMNFVGPPSRSTKTEDLEKTTKEDDEDEILPNVPPIKGPVREQNLHFDPSAEVQRIHRCSSDNNGTTIPSVESILENVEVLNGQAEEPYFELEECTVEEVVFQLEDQEDFLPTVPNVEEFQNSDAKIREWSVGKEGNIRSLLSTLQCVLWPGSGWKVVPLVELIESSSVRKAYQRALLCLHPDKLQQRGAPEHQKYIAGKVFDTLQEAWDQFGSVGQF